MKKILFLIYGVISEPFRMIDSYMNSAEQHGFLSATIIAVFPLVKLITPSFALRFHHSFLDKAISKAEIQIEKLKASLAITKDEGEIDSANLFLASQEIHISILRQLREQAA